MGRGSAFIAAPLYVHRLARPHQRQRQDTQSCRMANAKSPSPANAPSPPSLSRRALLSGATAAVIATALTPRPALAKVDIDIERFGDKELKVSAINKVKQNVRNVLTQKPELLPYFFSLTLFDALTFDAATGDGGPNGSLRLEMVRSENAGLREACEEIIMIQSLQRQDMSFADTCAFAGAVAIEVTGGPRIVIQLGREDAATADAATAGSMKYVAGASAADLREAFLAAGLDGGRDAVLFHGAIGSLNDIGQSRAQQKVGEEADEEDVDLDDVTYGKVSGKGKRGAVLVESNVSLLTLGGQKFSNSYLKAIVKAKDRSGLSQRDVAILEDGEMRGHAEAYAANNGKFVNDVADLYQKVSLLGSRFESLTL